jgi:hypothetical protein
MGRAGERRPILDAAVGGDTPAGCRTNISGVPAENDDLLSLPLSSKGGEGNGTAASEHRDACNEQAAGRSVSAGSGAGLGLNVATARLYTSGAPASCSLATVFLYPQFTAEIGGRE